MNGANAIDPRLIWWRPLVYLGLSIAWIVFWYRETAAAMVEIWYRSGTFGHSFLVLPISLWLIWRRREEILRVTPEVNYALLPVVAAVAFAWLLGDLATVNSVTQLALMTLIILAVPAMLGLRAASLMAFPLGFLYFAVPIGEFAIPVMIDWTAEFTVFALRLTGIPVHQEGHHFVVPSGRWSVVAACSGVRYLIASVCVGSLFAYLNFTSNKRRLAFILVSIIVPVVANWLRAYMIVMIGHLSDGRLAVGIDHLIYGWVFFGVVIFLLFLVGSRWAQDPPVASVQRAERGEVSRPPAHSRYLPLTMMLMFIVALPSIMDRFISRMERLPMNAAVRIGEIPGWRSAELPANWKPAFEEPSALISEGFGDGRRTVGAHIAYYQDQDYARKLIGSNNKIVRNDDVRWILTKERRQEVTMAGQATTVRRSVLVAESGVRLVVWQWYWIDGMTTASDYVGKFYEAIARLRGHGDGSAAVFVFAIDGPDADASLAGFLQSASPRIGTMLRELRPSR